MTGPFRIGAQDAEFVSRIPSERWPAVFAFRDRPTFLGSVALYAEIMAPFYGYNLVLNRVVTEAWRFQMLVFALHLHDTLDPDDPYTGLTVGNLQRICARQQIASAGRVVAYLNIMQLGGWRGRAPHATLALFTSRQRRCSF